MKKIIMMYFTILTLFTSIVLGDTTYGPELIQGGGNENGAVDKHLWDAVGRVYSIKSRTYENNGYLYPNNKEDNGGAYQSITTEIGKKYEVNAVLLGTDANKNEQFTSKSSYITVEDNIPTPNSSPEYTSILVSGAIEQTINFTFVATAEKTYLSLRSTRGYNYPNARAISVREVLEGVDTIKPVITLVGDTTVTLSVGDEYSDAGATASDNVDGDITSSIQTTSTVNTAVAGTYTVKYNVSDAAGNAADEVTRTVVVNEVADTVKPVITLVGDETVTLSVGDEYSDAGATALDNVDGDITSSIQTTSTVNTAVAGTYTVKYNVSDAAGNTADEVTRTVVVNHKELTIEEALEPANCLGKVVKSGTDLNDNSILDEDEITSIEENYEEGTPVTREELMTMIGNGSDVTSVNTCKITDMSHLFDPALYSDEQNETVTNFNQDISEWNTGSVTTMANMFAGKLLDELNSYSEKLFNQPIGNWDVSKVTDMSNMFAGCKSFNQPIGNWDVSNVINMWNMFGQSGFNQPLADWDVSSVLKMKEMFSGTPFNQPIGNWDVSSVTDMSYMFVLAELFNQSLSSWDTHSAITMEGMFAYALKFNQDINDWDVSNVTNMHLMFLNAQMFNQSLSSWDTHSVVTMEGMFAYALKFNQDINDWDVSNVTNMSTMFWSAQVFNQDIGDWDVSNVTEMNYMFTEAYAFDQNIGSWNITNVTTMEGMFWSVELSVENYDALLQGWSTQEVQHNVTFSGGESKYSEESQTARDTLSNDYEWIIDDYGIDQQEEHYIPELSDEDKDAYLTAINNARAEARSCGEEGDFEAADPVVWSEALYNAAYEHSQDMSTANFAAHNGSGTESDWTGVDMGDGQLGVESAVTDRVDSYGYIWSRLSENITGGTDRDSAQKAVDAWLASDGHCKNIMDPDVTEVGMAFSFNDESDYKYYWTQVFATPDEQPQ